MSLHDANDLIAAYVDRCCLLLLAAAALPLRRLEAVEEELRFSTTSQTRNNECDGFTTCSKSLESHCPSNHRTPLREVEITTT